MNKPFSTRIGELFAHIQDLIDTVNQDSFKIEKKIKKKNNKKKKILTFIPT